MKKKLCFMLLAVTCLSLSSGCAMTREENRVLLNSLDRTVQESSLTDTTTGKVLAAPVAFPVGVTAAALDMAVVTPARAAVPAAKDTNALLWENPQGSDLRQMMLLLPKALATPVVFLTDWACRTVFTTRF